MRVELLRHTTEPDMLCGQAAALCTGFTGDPVKALRGAMKAGHESVAEHASFTFYIEGISRVTLAQLTRHRMASYSVQSQRYCGADLELVVPDSMATREFLDDIMACKKAVERLYRKAVAAGVPEEDARYLVPQACQTKLICTMNARELRHFLSLRMCGRAQWEIRELAARMYALSKRVAPVLLANAGPGCVRGACPEGDRGCGQPYREVAE